jgi:hypothetical protein
MIKVSSGLTIMNIEFSGIPHSANFSAGSDIIRFELTDSEARSLAESLDKRLAYKVPEVYKFKDIIPPKDPPQHKEPKVIDYKGKPAPYGMKYTPGGFEWDDLED